MGLDRLSQISTMWTVLRQAHAGQPDQATAAMQQLVERYSPAIDRYLLGALRDREAASDVFQEFALRLVRGDFGRADPGRGRFRSFLKTALYHLIVDYQRRQKRKPQALTDDNAEPAAPDLSIVESDQEFLTAWRGELLNCAWQGLEEFEKQTGQPLHTVLRYRTDHPEERSPEMAARLQGVLGKPVSPEWVRKRLFLARDRFADLLLDEVARSIDQPTPDDLAQELLDLGLLDHCRAALERRRAGKPGPRS